MRAFIKKWITDGWLTEGAQIGCRPGEVRVFLRCCGCDAVYPHWIATMTAAEVQARGFLGCGHCRGVRVTPTILPAWKAAWWFVVRGWLMRRVLQRQRLWDPRIVAMESDLR